MIDMDGSSTYSKVVAVKMNSKNIVQVFPNPAHDVLFVQVNGINQDVSIQITDGVGRKLREEKITLNSNTSFSIDIRDLPKGIYYLLLKGPSENHQIKFVKQ